MDEKLRNVFGQSIILGKQGGGNMHLLPGRAITLSAEEQKSPQVQRLLHEGFAQIEKMGNKQGESASRQGAEAKRPEKKKAEN